MEKPTPTQEENDRAANGEDVTAHEPDGSPADTGVHPPPTDSEPKRRQVQPEAQRPHEGYQTRDVRADRHAQQRPKHHDEK